jgi:stage II sporulation protein AA (anti-sigma F factor antagonist)
MKECKLDYKNGTLTCLILCEIDHHTAKTVREATDALIEEKRPERVILDFSSVSFMDSSGIGLIMGRYKKIKAMEGEIFVCNLGITIQRIFKLSGLFKITTHSFEIDHIVNEEVTYEQN